MVRFLFISSLLIVVLSVPAFTARAQSVPVPEPNPNSEAVEQPAEIPAAETPKAEKPRIYQSACPALMRGWITASRLPPLSEGGCGERSPLEVSALAGFNLTGSATLNCRMATELAIWAGEVDTSAREILGTGLSRIANGTSYQCRRRNNAPTGKISEHGFANAFDIVGFELADGRTITLLDHWASPAEGQFLRAIRDKACTQFTTVLGPDSNPLHADHFHFDLGCHGKTCTHVICE